nr:TGB2 [Garlic yellow virus]QED44831.1 TGB2 [Garlic yellow virus]
MPLSPPPDHSKTFLACAIGATVAVCLFTLTRSTLPHVGDNIHHLPHGGCYQDGTKRIHYNSPRSHYPSSNLGSGSPPVFIVVLLLVGAILLSERLGQRRVAIRSQCCSTS